MRPAFRMTHRVADQINRQLKSVARTCVAENLEDRRLLSGYAFATLGNLDSNTSGYGSTGRLSMDAAGNLYGTSAGLDDPAGSPFGGTSAGTVFELAKGSNTPVALATFDGTNGAYPQGGVILDSAGNLYGTTEGYEYNGTIMSYGTVFELPSGSHTIITLAAFNGANGSNPDGRLVMDSAGNLYGTTLEGGNNFIRGSQADFSGFGTVFEVAKGSGAITTLAAFDDENGLQPEGDLAIDAAGNLYGTTDSGGIAYGTVFEVVKGSDAITDLVSFYPYDAHDNAILPTSPVGGVIIDAAGNLYGICSVNGSVAAYEVTGGSGVATPLAAIGGHSASGLLMDAAGNLFGTTTGGGDALGDGTVFEIAAGSSSATTIGNFDQMAAGADLGDVGPGGGLVADAAGNLYGTTYNGGPAEQGTVFELSPDAAVLPTHLVFTQQPQDDATHATLPAVVVAVEDPNGNIVTSNDDPIDVDVVNNPIDPLMGTPTEQAVDGVATFSDLSCFYSGDFTLGAVNGVSTPVLSNSFTISDTATPIPIPTPTPAPTPTPSPTPTPTPTSTVPYLIFAQQPSTATAGTAAGRPIVVDLLGADGGLEGKSHAKVTVSATDPHGKVSNYTVLAKNGVATFKPLLFKAAGQYTLQTTGAGFAAAASSTLTVLPAAATKMIFTMPPSSVTSGTPFTVQAELVDRFGNIATNDDSTVAVSLIGRSKGVTLGGATSVGVIDGLATFSDLTTNAPSSPDALKLADLKLVLQSKPFAVR